MKLTAKQQAARLEILAEVDGFGGAATWSQLHGRGHHYMQVSAAALRGDLRNPQAYHYELTEAGRSALRKEERG